MIAKGDPFFAALEPINLRLSFGGLAGLAEERMGRDARSGALLVLFGTRKDALEARLRMARTWSVESQLRYVLDIAMGEDGLGARDRISAENLALVRRMALDKPCHPDAGRDSQAMKQRMAGWDESHLLKLLRLGPRSEPFWAKIHALALLGAQGVG